MKSSSWDKLVEKSQYHFDTNKMDPRWDTTAILGHIDASTFKADVDDIVTQSKPANWETRGFKGVGIEIPKPELADEEYDLERLGIDPKVTITNMNWKLTPALQKITDNFALEDCMARIHVQMPGQLWHLHIDKLYKWYPADPSRVSRFFIQLTDWQPGQFWEFGNHHQNHWRAGEVWTFDWENVPHCTANAGHHPRVTLQLTGIRTAETNDYLASLPL